MTKKEIINKLIIYCFLYGYVIIAQAVLHMKSGMFERYLLPSVMVFAMLWMIDLYAEVRNLRSSVVYKAFLVLAVTALILIGNDQKDALKYAKDGADVTAALSKVAELSGNDTKIVVGIEYEADYSVSVYLQEHYGVDAVYNVFLTGIEDGMVKDRYNSNSYELQAIAITDADVYVDYQGSLETVFNEYGINKSLYTEFEFGNYRILINGKQML